MPAATALSRASAAGRPSLLCPLAETSITRRDASKGASANSLIEKSIAPLIEVKPGIGRAHLGAGRCTEAARWLRRALAENPGAVWLNRVLAPLGVEIGELQAARESLDRLRRAYPGITVSCIAARIGTRRYAAAQERSRRMVEHLAALGLPA